MQMQDTPLLECKGVTKLYGGFLALGNVNLTLPRGKIIALLGPNGSGKTTLIKLIAGLLTLDSGEIRICGQSVGDDTKTLVSYLPERNSLSLFMTPPQAVAYFADFFPDFDAERAMTMLNDLEVPLNKKIKQLSKGTREKVQLCLVMSRRAHIYLLDEPISGVDPAARDYILRTILQSYSPESSILLSTHLIYDIENLVEEFIFLHRGGIVRYDSVAHAREEEGKSLDQLFREVFRC